MDPAYCLEWPFFEPHHRELHDKLAAWASSRRQALGSCGHDIEGDTRDLAGELGKAGWLRYLVPATLGGHLPAIDVRSLCLIRETLAFHSGVADCAFAIQGLGGVPITLFGSDALKQKYLPGVIEGNRLGAFALSEPESGSDVANLRTSARRDGNGYVLNGAKAWISNAGIADHYIVFARTGAPGDAKGLAAFVVDAGSPGLAITEKPEIVAPHVIGTVALNDCRVDESALLARPGDGFRIAMSTLDIFRATVGAAALGFARRALHEAIGRVGQREVFGQKLAQFQATQMRIADMAVEVDAAALLVYRAAWTKDTQERRVTRESAMAKLYATEAAQRVIDSAVQLFGGLGVTVGSVVERLYREIRPLRIYEGTSEIQKIIIASQLLAKN
ncbi:MAG: acyl-CoA dehydrogenase family protein [Betaproteobacteria bacterium]|nr:acyl-CoA dehydrogenase family protein [Betaproteobacteria bacterium]